LQRPTFEFGRIVQMQHSGHAMHGPVRSYAELAEPFRLRQYDSREQQCYSCGIRAVDAHKETHHTARGHVDRQGQSRPAQWASH
jgi:hypothetical protein